MNVVLQICVFLFATSTFDAVISSRSSSQDTLKLVQIIFRHGDREPDESLENGKGKLTDIGKNQEFNLGLFFRERYGTLVSTDYQDSEIKVISSDKDRCIQSAQLVVYGLYKEFNDKARWSQRGKIKYEPIPVQTIPKNYDNILQVTSDCPRNKQLYEQRRAEMSEAYFARNSDMIEFFSKNSGNTAILDANLTASERLGELIHFQEQFFFNIIHGLNTSDWERQLLNDTEFLSLKVELNRYVNKNQERQRLYSGPLIQLLHENMKKYDTDSSLKIILFSGHDRSLLNLQIALGVDDISNPFMPDFAAAFMLELHQTSSHSEPFIEIWYRNDTKYEPHLLKIPKCGPRCTLKSFQSITKHLIPHDFHKECQAVTVDEEPTLYYLSEKLKKQSMENGSNNNSIHFQILELGIMAMIIGIVAFAFVVVKTSWQKNSADYTKL